jgi:tetratricopeptide (TPR) repeat protein
VRPAAPEETPASSGEARTLKALAPAAVIVLAAAVAVLPSLGGGFVFDDHGLIEDSALLRGPLWRIWLTTEPVDFWPLTYTTLWLDWRAWGTEPLGYRLLNVALHAATATLLWRVLRRLTVPGAWLAGLLFAVHPATVESVAWISERKNVLSGALFAGAVLLWLRHRASPRPAWYLAALGTFLLALLAKTSTVMLPVVLLGIALWRRGRLERRDLVETAPFFALSLALGAVTVWFQHARSLAGARLPRGLGERVGGAAWALLSYVRTALVPVDIPLVAAPWPLGSAEPLFWAPLAIVIAAIAVLAWGRRGPLRPVSFALGYHALMVLPVLGLVDMAYLRLAPVASHLQYLALMGPVALAAAALARLSSGPRRSAGLAATAVLAIALAAASAVRSTAFRDDLAYWEAAARGAPQSRVSALRLADELGARGRVPEARTVLADAAARLRDPADRLRAEAILLVHSRRFAEGLAAAGAAEQVRPDPFFQRDLGELLIQAGRFDDAIAVLAPVVRAHPNSAEHRYWLGSALALAGRLPEAAEVVRVACGQSRGHFGTCTALVMVLARMGQADRARAELASALALSPWDAEVERLLAESGVPEAR